MRTPPPRKAGPTLSPQRALVLAAVTAGGVLAIYVAINVALHVVRTIRLRNAMDQAMLEAQAPSRVAVPSTPEPTTPSPLAEPVNTLARLTARELAKQSLPSTVSLHCNESIGSGFFVEPELILTNAHVLCPVGEKIQAVLSDGQRLAGETVRSSQAVDLALVKVPGARGKPLPLGDVGDLALGDRIMMIGSPMGLEFTVHEGLVSHLGRVVQGVAYIQLDAKVNPGNSGGPIIDEQGRVVGVITLKQAQAEGIGLAVPINYAYGPALAYVNPPSAAAASSKAFKTMLAAAGANGGMQMPATEGVSIDVLPLLAAVDMDQYRNLVVRVLRVQDASPGYYEATINVWSSAEKVCTLKGDVVKWKEVDPDQAGAGVPEEMLRALKKLGAVHIFMGEATLGLQTCNPEHAHNLELELVGGNPISNRMYVRTY
jgi:serine protease Do